MIRYCPKCGGNLSVRYFEADKRTRKVCDDCGSIIYEHSKPCVGALVLKEGRILLTKRASEPFKEYWDIPGGFLERGEHPTEGIVRELQEETGLQVEPIEILDIFMDFYGSEGDSTLNICYVCKVLGGKAKAKSDAIDIKWFDIESLPDDIAFEWSKRALNLLKKRYP